MASRSAAPQKTPDRSALTREVAGRRRVSARRRRRHASARCLDAPLRHLCRALQRPDPDAAHQRPRAAPRAPALPGAGLPRRRPGGVFGAVPATGRHLRRARRKPPRPPSSFGFMGMWSQLSDRWNRLRRGALCCSTASRRTARSQTSPTPHASPSTFATRTPASPTAWARTAALSSCVRPIRGLSRRGRKDRSGRRCRWMMRGGYCRSGRRSARSSPPCAPPKPPTLLLACTFCTLLLSKENDRAAESPSRFAFRRRTISSGSSRRGRIWARSRPPAVAVC